MPTMLVARSRSPPGLARNELTTIKYRASVTPTTCYRTGQSKSYSFPISRPSPATQRNKQEPSHCGLSTTLSVQPLTTAGLIVISEQEKAQYGCAHVPVNLAWRFTSENWQASIKVVRKTPRLVGARAVVFSSHSRCAHYALRNCSNDVDTARSQRLEFSLPATTPSEITLRGLGDTQVKESTSQEEGDRRK